MMSRCEVCRLREWVESNPNSLIARLWRWHSTQRLCWKTYQTELTTQQIKAVAGPSKIG